MERFDTKPRDLYETYMRPDLEMLRRLETYIILHMSKTSTSLLEVGSIFLPTPKCFSLDTVGYSTFYVFMYLFISSASPAGRPVWGRSEIQDGVASRLDWVGP